MFAASTYEEIVEHERRIENMEIVVFLFVKPTSQDATDIIQAFELGINKKNEICQFHNQDFKQGLSKRLSKVLRWYADISFYYPVPLRQPQRLRQTHDPAKQRHSQHQKSIHHIPCLLL